MNQIQEKNSIFFKVLFVFTIATLFFVLLSPMRVKAAESISWTALGNGVYQLDGTDIKAEVAPGTVHITGNGAIPDFDYWKLNKRPWATCECQSVTIDDTITSMIGTIPYTSMDSILSVSQSSGTGRSYVLDNNSLASAFQGKTNPTIQNVYSATDSRAPWNDLATYWNGNIYTSICRITGTSSAPYIVTATRSYQGIEAYRAFAAYIGTNTFATTFNITVTANDANKAVISKTNASYQYTLTIPEAFRASGRIFKLLGIGQNGVTTYDDIDTDGNTITFSTDSPTASYALVYSGN